MPKFLEAKLKKEYGAKSDVPYKIMNAKGLMRGNKTTAKGEAMQKKHEAKVDAKANRVLSQSGGGTESYNWRNRHGQAKVRKNLS